MLQIRREQMEMFEEVALRNFNERMLNHLRQFFPRSCSALGEAGTLSVIEHGRERASRYGLTDESSIRTYLDLMFMLGGGFDADPQFPWAAEILNDPGAPDEMERVGRLHEKAASYHAEIAGGIDSALKRVREAAVGDMLPPATPDFYKQVISFLRGIFPEKCDYLGEYNLRRLIQRGSEAAQRYAITDGRGVAVYVSLMFMLGGGFDADPQFPWAVEVLSDEALDGAARAEQLHSGALEYLDRWSA